MSKKKQKSTKKKKIVRKTKIQDLLSNQHAQIGLGIVFLISILALSPVLNTAFLNYDDDIYITKNPYIVNLNFNSIKALFSDYFANQYSPVAMLIMGIEAKIMGLDNPFYLKAFSLFFHFLNTYMVFRLIKLLFKKNGMALIVAALFCFHPMQLESIAWLAASMKIETFTFFFLASLVFYVQYLNKKNRSFYWISFGLFILSCFSKEQAVSLAVTLFAIDYFKERKLLSQSVLLEKVPFLAIALIFGFITIFASEGIEQNANVLSFGIVDRLLFVSYSFVAYIAKIAFPVNLSFLYFFPMKGQIPTTYYLSIIALIPLLFALYYSLKKGHKILAFGMLFFAINIGLAVVSQAFAVRDVIMADRYVYLPIIGLFILLAYGVTSMIEKKPKLKPMLLGGLALYTVFLLFLTRQRTAIWQDSITVFTDAIEKSSSKETPFLSLAYLNRGLEKKVRGNIPAAMEDYNRAIAINAADHKALLNRGNIYFNQKNYDLAIADYNKAEAINKTNAKIYSSRGAAYAGKQNYNQAILDLSKALELDPQFKDALSNRMLVYYFNQNYQAALQDCNAYLSSYPNDHAIVNQRGLIHQNLGRNPEAEADFSRSIQLNPNAGAYYLNRSYYYNRMGNRAAALQDAQSAQRLGQQVDANYLNGLR